MKVMISIFVGIGLFGICLLKFHPVFGGGLSDAKLQTFSQSSNFRQNKFMNQIPTSMDMNPETLVTIVRDFVKGNPQGRPNGAIPVEFINTISFQEKGETRIYWFGHSTVLLEIEGKRVLIDPMFAKTPSPFPLVGGKRYSETLPVKIEELPSVDIVILSHDHYDHLDYDSIMSIKDKVGQFYVPLGVGSHLERWGIEKEKIKEHDWWAESDVGGLKLVATPARHFSGRGLFNRDTTLWCSWVVIGKQTRVFFSGDSGFGPHFAQIGEKYGPFDWTLMECGQYDERWSAIHMMPEETVQAHIDVKGNNLIPIHWGAFSLALHDWTDPIERVTKAAKERQIFVSTPKIGEPIRVGAVTYPSDVWWR